MADYLNIAGRVRTTASDGVALEAQELKDLNLNKSQQEINADVQTGLGNRYTKEETYSKEQLDELITTPDVNYVSVVATNATTAVTDILPATGEANTIYRVGNWNVTQYDPTMYALYAWNGSAYVCLAVRSFVGDVYDISVNHPDGQGNPTPYADLTAALGTDGANIPADIRRGGMSIKFIQGTVQSSDNKYVQARCMAQSFTTDVTQWQGVDDEPTAGSKNLVESGGVLKSLAEFIPATKELQTASSISSNFSLKGDGSFKSDNTSQLNKYKVHEGDIMYLKLSKDNAGVFQWQDSSTTSSGHVIGSPVNIAVDGLVKVPTGVTYLIVSQLQSNDTNKVYTYYNNVDATPTFNSKGLVESGGVEEFVTERIVKLINIGNSATGAQNGDIYYNTTDKLLRRKNGNSFVTVPFAPGAIYNYNNNLFCWNGNDLVNVNQINYPNQFALIRDKYPVLNTTDNTFTIPSGAKIVCAISPYIKTLSSDVVFTKEDSYDSHYIILDFDNLTIRGVRTSNPNIQLSNSEVIVCLVNWYTKRVFLGLFSEYYVDDELYISAVNKSALDDVSANVTELSSKVNVLESLIKKEEYDDSDLSEGYYILTGSVAPINIHSDSDWRGIKKQIKAGDSIRIFTKGGPVDARAYALTDVGLNILTVAAAGVDTLNTGIVLETSVDGWVYVNCAAANMSDFNLEITRLYLPSVATELQVPCMYNPRVDFKKSNLRIFDIGNSYTADSTHYINNIADAAGIGTTGFSHYKAIRSAASFKSWVNCYNDSDTLEYTISKILGDTISDIAGSGEAGDGAAFRNALTNGNWDLIIIHQASTYANNYDLWEGTGNGGYLKELIRIIRKTNPNAAIGFLLVHSYRSTYSGNTEESSLLRWQNIAESVKKLVANYGIDFIIPYGTAVQNLRASTTLTDSDNEFSSDGVHMADGIGDYVASCCYFQSLYAPMFNKCILGNTWRKTDFDETSPGVKNIDNTNALLAQKAAFAATYDWYNINNPDNYSI